MFAAVVRAAWHPRPVHAVREPVLRYLPGRGVGLTRPHPRGVQGGAGAG